MTVNIHIQYILCKRKIYNEDNEVIKEYNFIVDAEWLTHMWKRHFKKLFQWDDDFNDFLNSYDPDYEGMVMYLIAKKHGQIEDEGWEDVDPE